MGHSVGHVLTPDVAAAVNFTFWPVSWDKIKHTGSCPIATDAEACALEAGGCVGGCTGARAAGLATFITCFEKKFSGRTGECTGSDTQDTPCISSAGIDPAAYAACRADSTKLNRLRRSIDLARNPNGTIPDTVPDIWIAGESRCPDVWSRKCGSKKGLKKALCDAGVQAACTHDDDESQE